MLLVVSKTLQLFEDLAAGYFCSEDVEMPDWFILCCKIINVYTSSLYLTIRLFLLCMQTRRKRGRWSKCERETILVSNYWRMTKLTYDNCHKIMFLSMSWLCQQFAFHWFEKVRIHRNCRDAVFEICRELTNIKRLTRKKKNKKW